MFPALRPILNKGGAGRYVSREESVERLLPVAQRHLDHCVAYDAAVQALPEGPVRERLEAMGPYLRTETAKVSETILSLGGAPPTGVDREPATAAEGSPRDVVDRLIGAERDFGRAVREEVDAVHHQERTRAILEHNAAASEARAGLLREVAADLTRG